MGGIDPENGFVYWDGPPRREDLGVRVVLLTDRQARTIFRAVNILAWLVELGFHTKLDQPLDTTDADELRHLARTVLPEGIKA